MNFRKIICAALALSLVAGPEMSRALADQGAKIIPPRFGAEVNVQGTPAANAVLTYNATRGVWEASSGGAPTSSNWSTVLSNGASTSGQKPSITAGDYIVFANSSGAAVSAANTGRIIYNSSTQTFQVSVNGGAYTTLATGSTTLQQAYDASSGNITLSASGGSINAINPLSRNGSSFTATQQDSGASAFGIFVNRNVAGNWSTTTPAIAFSTASNAFVGPQPGSTASNATFHGGDSTVTGAATGAAGFAAIRGGSAGGTDTAAGGAIIDTGDSKGTGGGVIAFKVAPGTTTGTTTSPSVTIANLFYTTTTASDFQMFYAGTNAAGGAVWRGQRSRGTIASPSALSSGDTITLLTARGYGATAYPTNSTAQMRMDAAEAFTDSAMGTRIVFSTTPTGSITRSDRFTVEASGNLQGTSGLAMAWTSSSTDPTGTPDTTMFRSSAGVTGFGTTGTTANGAILAQAATVTNTAASTSNLLTLTKSPASSSAGDAINVTMGANATGALLTAGLQNANVAISITRSSDSYKIFYVDSLTNGGDAYFGGNARATSTGAGTNANWILSNSTGNFFTYGYIGMRRSSDGNITLNLAKIADGVLGLSNSTNAAGLRIYNTADSPTSPTNSEFLVVTWASNVASIQPAKTGTGTVRTVQYYVESGVYYSSGAGSPEGVVTASVGSIYSRDNGGAGTSLYVKESGSGNTGWVAVSTSGGGGVWSRSGTTLSPTTAGDNVSIPAGTITASAPGLTITQTWNNAGVAFTGMLVNVTDTLSTTSKIFDFQANGASQLALRGVSGAYQLIGPASGNFRLISPAGDVRLEASSGSNSALVLVNGATFASFTPAGGGAGLTLASGTVTTSAPVLTATQTWNAGGVTFTGALVNVTNSASAATSRSFVVQTGSSDRHVVFPNGALWLSDNGTTPSGLTAANTAFGIFTDSNASLWRCYAAGGSSPGAVCSVGTSRGTTASPTAVQNGDLLAQYGFAGYVGATSTWLTGANIEAYVDGTPADSARLPSLIVFKTFNSSEIGSAKGKWCIRASGDYQGRSDVLLGWVASSTDPTGSLDTAYSRTAAGKVALGNGSASDKSGTLQLASVELSPGIDTTAGDAATINKCAGRFRKDTSGATFTLTDSFITANSIVVLTPANAAIDATATTWTVSAGSGSATITFNAAPSANFDMNFVVIN